MPRIPVYTADGRLPGGPLSPDASPLAFNEAAGLSAVAAGLDNASQVATQINLKRASDIATTWGSSTASTIEEESADFLDKNRNSPTIAQDYKVWAKARFDKAKKEAPNELALKYITREGEASISRKYATALNVGSNNLTEQLLNEVETSTAQITQTYQLDQSIDPSSGSALRDISAAYDRQIESINSRLTGVAPRMAAKQRAYVAKQVAIAVAPDNAEFAREIIKSSTDIDADHKASLFSEIDRLEGSKNALYAQVFQRQIEKDLKEAEKFLTPLVMPSDQDFAVFGKDAEKVKIHYVDRYKAVNDAAAFMDDVKDKNSNYQMRAYAKLAEDKNVEAMALVNSALERSVRMQEKAPADWLKQNNGEVKEAFAFASMYGPDDPERKMFQDAAIDTLLKYQGTFDADQFNTGLSPQEEAEFQKWKAKHAPSDSGYDYDLRGAFKDGFTPDERGHWPDKHKKPNHPTFSNESKFAEQYAEYAGSWKGEEFTPGSKSFEEEEAKYLGIPRDFQHALDTATAESWGKKLNSAPPNQKAALLEAFDKEFGRHADWAWNDLQRLPSESRVAMDLRVARVIDDVDKRAQVLGAISSPKASERLTNEKQADLKKRIDGAQGEPLRQLVRSFKGDNFQRLEEMAQLERITMLYANALSLEMSEKDAMDVAVKTVVTDNYAITSINGQTLAFRRQVGDLRMDDRDAGAIKQELERFVAGIDPAKLDMRSLNLPSVAGVNAPNFYRDFLRSQAVFIPTPDGESVSLYAKFQDGPPVVLKSSAGNPVSFKVADLLAQYRLRIERQLRSTDELLKNSRFNDLGTVGEFPGLF